MESRDEDHQRVEAVREQLREHPDEGAGAPAGADEEREESGDLKEDTDAAREQLRQQRKRGTDRS